MEIREKSAPQTPVARRSRNAEFDDRELRITIVGGTLVAPLIKRVVLRAGVSVIAAVFTLALLARWLW